MFVCGVGDLGGGVGGFFFYVDEACHAHQVRLLTKWCQIILACIPKKLCIDVLFSDYNLFLFHLVLCLPLCLSLSTHASIYLFHLIYL